MLQVAKKKSRKLSQNVRKIKIRMFEKKYPAGIFWQIPTNV